VDIGYSDHMSFLICLSLTDAIGRKLSKYQEDYLNRYCLPPKKINMEKSGLTKRSEKQLFINKRNTF